MAVVITMTGTGRNCTLTSGQPTITVSSATDIIVGATIQGTGIPTGTRVGQITGTTVTLVNASGVPVNATAGGTQSLIFSSVWGSILTVNLTASGDTATMQNIYNAGFGVMSDNLGQRHIFFPGAFGIEWRNIVAGALFDFQNWTIEFGARGYWAWEQSTILGELRGGYLQNGTQFIRSSGPTFISRDFKNSTAGGSNMFTGTATGTVTGTFRMNNLRVIAQGGVNRCPQFNTGRMFCIVDGMILDYQGDGGPNAGFSGAFGAINNTTVVRANSGIGSPNGTNFAIINGLSYSGLYSDVPQHKFAIPNNYVLEGYAPQVLSTQFLGGFQDNTTETYANIDLSTAGWGLTDLITRYQRFGGPNEIRFPRRVSLQFNDSTGADLTGVTLFIRSGATTLVNAVQAGDYSANTQALVLNWTANVGSYRTANTTTNTISQVAQIRRYGFIEQSTSYSLNLASYSQPFFMLRNVHLNTITEAQVQAYTAISLDYVNKKVLVSGVFDPNKILAKVNYELALTANSSVADFTDVQGTSLVIKNGWTIEVGVNGVINKGTTLTGIIIDGKEIVNNGQINIPFSDLDGSRVSITGLNPENFAVTWHLRYRKQAVGSTPAGTWTNVSGTGNTTTILAEIATYDVMIRVPGYDWKTTEIDTNETLSLDVNLSYHVSANNTPQYTMSFDEDLEAAINFDYATNSVSIVNTTGAIINPGFAEFYQATQRIQHIPALVWIWESPVTANSTSQKILIPTGNAISFFLTENSNASVKATCPVIHQATGQSADDRVRGNSSGYSIILGSPATAESAGLQSAIVSELMAKLGGNGYAVDTDSLKKIKDQLNAVKTKVDTIENYNDETLSGKVDAVKAAVDTLENYDDSALINAIGTPLQVNDYTAPDNTSIGQILTKVETLENTDLTGIATTQNVSDAKNEILEAISDIPETDISSLALETSLQSLKTKVDTLENYDDTTLSGIVNSIKTTVESLENYDDTTLISKINAIKAVVDGIENYDDATLSSKVDAVKAVVDALENYNDAPTQTKLDAIKTAVDALENTDVSGLPTATEVKETLRPLLTVINDGVKNASKIKTHKTNLPA